MAQAGPKEWYDAIPPVSRAWFTGAVAVGVAGKLGMLNAMILLLNLPPFGPWMVDLVWKKSQVGVGPGCGGCRVNPPAPMRAPRRPPPPPSVVLAPADQHFLVRQRELFVADPHDDAVRWAARAPFKGK